MARGFQEGQTPGATVYFNFARMQKSPSRPVLIYASDFDVISDKAELKTLEQFWPSKFDRDYNAIADTSSEKYDEKNINILKENLDAFLTRKVEEYKKSSGKTVSKSQYIAIANNNTKSYKNGEIVVTDYSDNIGTYAYFVYGKAHDKNDGAQDYEVKRKRLLTVPIFNKIYCGRTDNCRGMPAPSPAFSYEVPSSNIFTDLAALDSSLTDFSGFVTNTQKIPNDIISEFVSRYSPSPSTGIDIGRSHSLASGQETMNLRANEVGSTTIRIVTDPWLIYTPNGGEAMMKTLPPAVGDYAKIYSGVPQYYNYFLVKIINAAADQWGGEGQVKSGKEDDVGSFAGGSDSSNSTSDTSTRILDTGNARDMYNQRIDW